MVKETNIKKMVEESARACLVNATEAESWVSASAKTNSKKGVGGLEFKNKSSSENQAKHRDFYCIRACTKQMRTG